MQNNQVRKRQAFFTSAGVCFALKIHERNLSHGQVPWLAVKHFVTLARKIGSKVEMLGTL